MGSFVSIPFFGVTMEFPPLFIGYGMKCCIRWSQCGDGSRDGGKSETHNVSRSEESKLA